MHQQTGRRKKERHGHGAWKHFMNRWAPGSFSSSMRVASPQQQTHGVAANGWMRWVEGAEAQLITRNFSQHRPLELGFGVRQLTERSRRRVLTDSQIEQERASEQDAALIEDIISNWSPLGYVLGVSA